MPTAESFAKRTEGEAKLKPQKSNTKNVRIVYFFRSMMRLLSDRLFLHRIDAKCYYGGIFLPAFLF
jgi:hypothetical protein